MSDEKKDVVPSQYRDKYKATGGTCGDFIATQLSKVADDGVEGLASIKAENNIEADRWATFNPGMQRMNLANVLRGRFLKGETIVILGKQYNAKHLAEDFNGTVEDSPATLAKLADYLELQDNERTVTALQKLFFPPAPKGPTAEERAAAKEAKEKAKADAKAEREAAAAEKRQAKEAEKAEKVAKREADKKAREDAKAAKAAEKAAKKAEPAAAAADA